MGKYTNIDRTESGVASLFVVLILMTILALISIGFSHLMNREVRQSLDRQLTTEAYYAAESGVNDGRTYLQNGGPSFPGCKPPNSDLGNKYFVQDGDVSGDGISRYSCITTTANPKELVYKITPGNSISIKLSGADLTNLSKLYFGWENADPYGVSGPKPLKINGCTVGASISCSTPQENTISADNTGLLRVGIYPGVPVGSCSDVDQHGNRFNRYFQGGALSDRADATIECASRNYFLYPNAASSNPGAPNFIDSGMQSRNANKDGSFVLGNCDPSGTKPNTTFASQATPRYCNSVINNVYPVRAGSASYYYLRLTAVYRTINVSIQASDNAAPTPNALNIANAEGIVDSTGAGNDVLRRIQARAPLSNSISDSYGLQSMESICKLFRNDVPSPGIYNNPHLDSGASAFNSDNGRLNCSYPTGGNEINPGGFPPINIEPPPVVAVWANPPNPLDPGQSTNILWQANADADTCSSPQFNTGGATQNLSGVNTGPLGPGDYTYTVNCDGPGGSGTGSYTVHVNNPPPAPPPCDVGTSGFRNPDGTVTVSASAGGCGYYFNNVVGWNGGGTWTAAEPPDFNFCQDGGTDPWGMYAESCTWIP